MQPWGDLASQRRVRSSSVCRRDCKDGKRCPGLAAHPALPLCQALAALKATCKALGQGHCWGRAGWIKEEATACHGTRRGQALVTTSCPTCWALPPFHCFTSSSVFEFSWFGSFKDFADVPMSCRNRRAGNARARLSSLPSPDAAIAACPSVCSVAPVGWCSAVCQHCVCIGGGEKCSLTTLLEIVFSKRGWLSTMYRV